MIGHQAGEFNIKVTIEQLDATQDTYGDPAKTWSTFATWWCKENPVTGSESYGAQAIQAKAELKLEGNYIAGVTAKMRVNNHGVFYDITSPPLVWDGHSSRYMTLLCKVGVNLG